MSAAELERAAILVSVATLVLLLLLSALRREWRSFLARRRNQVAQRGERRGESVLERSGYTIVSRQARGELKLRIDDRDVSFPLRCDLLVERQGRRYLVEVKTGSIAPSLQHAPTRRQLLEYALAFDVDGVLLYDAEREHLARVEIV